MDDLKLLLDVIWVLIGAFLVFFMQAGFAMVESGFTRAKNAGNIIMKNLMDFTLGSLFYFLFGFALMFGDSLSGLVGSTGFFNPESLTGVVDLPIGVFIIFQTVFCATAATIVSGAMAERTKFISYLLYSAAITILVYPITGHWIWGGGWLSELGFHDFAGSTAVHAVGGMCAIVGAKVIGPRLGKYSKDGKVHAIPGHNIPLAALGVFILWFGWFGFNGGSTLGADLSIGDIFMTTNLAAAAGTLGALVITWIRFGKPDVSMALNGSLAGLVAITAGCDAVSNYSAIAIGLIAGVFVVLFIEFVDKVLKIDDPVGASGVHFACGVLGTILTGVFAKSTVLAEVGMSRIQMIGVQALGAIAVCAFVGIMAFIIFKVIDVTIGLRVNETEEIEGLDIHEHGINAYPDFSAKL